MAKKITKPVKKPVKAAGPSKIKGAVNFFKSNQFKYTLGAFLLLFSGYMAVAFISYIFSGSVDQSKLDLSFSDFIDPSVQVQNFAGKGGAYLAEQFINLGFGFPSFFFILIFSVAALNLFGYKEIRFLKTFFFSFLWMLWLSIALALLLPTIDNQFLKMGGDYGLIISGFLSSLLGAIGATLILAFILFTLLILTFKQFLPWFSKVISKKEKEPATAEQLAEEALALAEQEKLMQIEDPAISKRITEENKVKVIVDPDSHDDDDFEIENTVSKKDVELSIEDMLFDHEPVVESPKPKTKVKEPELQVAEKIVDELADGKVMPVM
ncbi:DNA translocase FtsK 4TM domain-containing protein, partial [bacterium]|nr:DNA translocase FtsK 4TM domain-containing protein [bacterium]